MVPPVVVMTVEAGVTVPPPVTVTGVTAFTQSTVSLLVEANGNGLAIYGPVTS